MFCVLIISLTYQKGRKLKFNPNPKNEYSFCIIYSSTIHKTGTRHTTLRERMKMTSAENKEIGFSMMEVVNQKNIKLLDDLVAPGYVNKQLKVRSREDLKEILRRQYKGFPDVHRTLEDIIADEDSVWIRVKITGTHTGEYRGIAPTGKEYVMDAVPHYRIVDGKIVEGWSVWNPLNLFMQLGVIEYKGFPDEVKQPL
jgi:predicted ester cyclase